MEIEKLNRKKIIELLNYNRDILKLFGVKRIGLFGSFLKGKQKKDSDIDLIVEFNELDPEKYFMLSRLLEQVLRREKIDLIVNENLRPELKHIKKEAEYVKI